MILGQHKETENYKHWTPEEEQILRDNCGKMSFNKMLELFSRKRSPKALRKKSIKLGLISGYRYKEHSHDETFWETPNPLNSYWAGFFFADGCINKNSISDNYTFDLSLASKDLNHLEILKNQVKFTGQIKSYQRKNYKKQTFKSVSTLQICSIRKWKKDLEQNFGIIPNKTKRANPPNLNSLYLKLCFCLGYIDGDGWVITRNGHKMYGVTVGVVSSNLIVLEWIRNVLDENFYTKTMQNLKTTIHKAKGNYYYFTITGTRGLVIIDYLRKLQVPKLARKWDNPKILALLQKQKEKRPKLFLSQPPISSVIPLAEAA